MKKRNAHISISKCDWKHTYKCWYSVFNSDSFRWASCRWESMCFSGRPWKMWHCASSKKAYYVCVCVHTGVTIYKFILTFVCVRARRPIVSTYQHVYAFKHQQPPGRYPLAPACVHRVYWDPTESTEPDRPLCRVSVRPLILTLPIPPSELDVKQMKWTHIPSRWASVWKQEALKRGPLCTPPTLWGWRERRGKKWQGRTPMGCYSNDRFVEKALHARQKHKDTFHHQRNVSKCFIPQNMIPAVS